MYSTRFITSNLLGKFYRLCNPEFHKTQRIALQLYYSQNTFLESFIYLKLNTVQGFRKRKVRFQLLKTKVNNKIKEQGTYVGEYPTFSLF